ncbi:MAG: PstA family ABC transporter permease [Solirubrobacterales bacterium]
MSDIPERRRLTPEQLKAPVKIRDRIGLAMCWFSGLFICFAAASILLYLLFKGLSYMSFDLLFTRPSGGEAEDHSSGGILDPMLGTFILAALGTAFALPLGVAIATWLSEFGRPFWLARATESGIEMIAGIPSIVLALFGTVIFTSSAFKFLSRETDDGIVTGRSFFVAAFALMFIALPTIVGSTREGLQSIPGHVREASYAVGKTKIATIRRILWPSVTPQIVSGTVIGMGRIIGDTAIIVILLGATVEFFPAAGNLPGLNILRGQGSTLTTFVYEYSPTGEGNQPEKAFAAAFVLMLIVIALNAGVELINRKWKAPDWKS